MSSLTNIVPLIIVNLCHQRKVIVSYCNLYPVGCNFSDVLLVNIKLLYVHINLQDINELCTKFLTVYVMLVYIDIRML